MNYAQNLKRRALDHVFAVDQWSSARGAKHASVASITPKLLSCSQRLSADYDNYVSEVSSPDMAASLEVSALLLALCEDTNPSSLLDLGSGFSSFVLRSFARESGGTVVSVDHDTAWLERTRSYLKDKSLGDEMTLSWEEFSPADYGTFDLVFSDMTLPLRVESTAKVAPFLAENGTIILDDMHKPGFHVNVRRALKKHGFSTTSLRSHTLDSYGRFASIAAHGN